MPIQIHGKSYNTVAERIIKAGDDLVGVQTEVLNNDPVVIKATITVLKNKLPKNIYNATGERILNSCVFTGISAANASKQIEKESPYEVAETSAVGRALAFAGYETTNGIASAEEMQKATHTSPSPLKQSNTDEVVREPIKEEFNTCSVCGINVKKPYTKCYKCSQIKKL